MSNIWQQRSQNNNHCTWRDIFTEYWIWKFLKSQKIVTCKNHNPLTCLLPSKQGLNSVRKSSQQDLFYIAAAHSLFESFIRGTPEAQYLWRAPPYYSDVWKCWHLDFFLKADYYYYYCYGGSEKFTALKRPKYCSLVFWWR